MSSVEVEEQRASIEPRSDLHSSSFFRGSSRALVAGTLSAVVTLSYATSYAALIFSGPELRLHLGAGLHVALMSAWIIALVVALGSPFFFAIAGPDSNATAVLALMAAAVVVSLAPQNVPASELGASVLVMLAASAVLVGAIVFLLGVLKGGRLVRFLPYPVVGGFMAGTGFLVAAGGFKVLTGRATWSVFMEMPPVPPLAWAVAAGVCVALLVLPRFYKHFLIMPAVIAAGVTFYYVGVAMMKLDGGAPLLAADAGAETASVPKLAWLALSDVHWRPLLAQWPNLLAMTVVVVITILLNATGLDLATRHDADFDRELRVNGLANLLAGLSGGMIGYISVSRSLLNFKAGAASRLAGLWTAVLCLGAAFVFTSAIAYFPRPVLAGLLLYLGIGMLREWCWDTFARLPFRDYGLIVCILLLIALHGLMLGVVFGLIVASVFFVYSYSQTNCIKHAFASNTRFSNKERSMEQVALLKQHGGAARAFCLQGYLFFGTSSSIVETCRAAVETGGARYLLLDFRMVQGLDASAVLSFTKLEQICTGRGVRLLLSGLRPETERVLQQSRFIPRKGISVFEDLDRGLEWVEDELLSEQQPQMNADQKNDPASAGSTGVFTALAAEMDLRRILAAHFAPDRLDVLIEHCHTQKLASGEYLFRKGDPGDALYFVERGELSVLLPLPGGQTKRLRTFGPGTVVGEMALYSRQPRSADVVTDGNCRIRRLSADDFAHLEREHPDVAIQFHSFVVKLLATRLTAANEQIRELL